MRGRLAGAAVVLALAIPPAAGQDRVAAPPAQPQGSAAPESPSDTWIFSGVLEDGGEVYSGTLITGKSETAFELKLADGASCDGDTLNPSMGLVRLPEITCTDNRTMRALFVPQGHETLKVFGHVGEARFTTVAHLLGTQAIPEPKQTTAPHAPPVEPRAAPPTHAAPRRSDPG